MNPLITSRIDQIEHLCKANHVLELYTFGSINRIEDFNELSDIDFLVEFKEDEIGLEEYAESYFNLTFGFEDIFEREIDLTTVKSLSNPYFIEELKKSKILVYSENIKING